MPLRNYMIAHKENKYFHPQKHIAHSIKISRGFWLWCNASINCTCRILKRGPGRCQSAGMLSQPVSTAETGQHRRLSWHETWDREAWDVKLLIHSVVHQCVGIVMFWRETHVKFGDSSILFLGFGTLVIWCSLGHEAGELLRMWDRDVYGLYHKSPISQAWNNCKIYDTLHMRACI